MVRRGPEKRLYRCGLFPFDHCPGYGIDASLCGKVWERALKPILWLPTLMYRMVLPSGHSPLTLTLLTLQN